MQPKELHRSPSVLSPSSRDVNFKKWHVNREQAERPTVGRLPQRPKDVVFQNIQAASKEANKHRCRSAAELSSSVLDSDSFDSRRHWAAQTLPANMWGRKGNRLKPIAVANDALESQWAKGIFDKLPSVGRRRSPFARSKNSGMSASCPGLDDEASPADSMDLGYRKESKRSSVGRRSSVESNVSEHKRTSISAGGEREVHSKLPMEIQEWRASVLSTGKGLNKSLKAGRGLSFDSDGQCVASDTAHKMKLPLATVLESRDLFAQYALLPGRIATEDTNELLKHGVLKTDDMMKLVKLLVEKSSADGVGEEDFALTPKEVMGVIDSNMDGTVDFREFTHWYHERAFLEYVNLTKSEIHTRRIGQRLGISVADMDFYKLQFEKYDTDGSGEIDLDEFRELMHMLMKIPTGLRIPESRIMHFWQDADADHGGHVDIEEFVEFYSKNFEGDGPNPMEDYYKAIRRVNVAD